MKKRFVCRKMLKTGLCCIALDVISNILLALLLIIVGKNIDIIISIIVPSSLALTILIVIIFLMIPYLGRISYENGVVTLWKFKKKYEITSNKKVIFIFRDSWTPRFTGHRIYPMKIRIKGTKKEIPIQIIDKEVIEFLRLKLNYVVDPQDFDFNRI